MGNSIVPGGVPPEEPTEEVEEHEFVSEPAKVMRVGSMIKQLLDEVRSTELDEPSRVRLRAIYDTSILELGSALSPDLRDELNRLAFPFAEEGTPTEIELRVAQAQLVGLARGPVPRHPGDAVRPADGGPPAAREHAGRSRPAPARYGWARWPRWAPDGARGPARHLPVAPSPSVATAS